MPKYRIHCNEGSPLSSWDEPRTKEEVIDTFYEYAQNEWDEAQPREDFTFDFIQEMWNVTIVEINEEQPLYYSSTVENGKVVKHEGDPKYAVYESVINETQRRAGLWHKWVKDNVGNDAYDELGIMNADVHAKYTDVRNQFMNGEREQ